MDRRHTIVALACLAALEPLRGALAQKSKLRRVGYLAARRPSTPSNPDLYYDAFVEGMRELGYVQGKNLLLEWRFAENHYERLPALAAELVKAKVEVIVSHSTPGTKAAQQATGTIPIVMHGNDPLAAGIVRSLARPEGNVTGMSLTVGDVTPKQVELLKALLPKLSRAAIMVNPQNESHAQILGSFRAAAEQARIQVLPVSISKTEELAAGFALMAREGAQAVLIASDSLLVSQRHEIARLAIHHRLPSLVAFREDARAGGLMTYALDIAAIYKRAAVYVDKILQGAKPAELPIEQATKFLLVINLKTARQLNLAVPKQLLQRADEIIQ